MVKAVIFDLDGTLLDTSAVYAKATELTFPDMALSSNLAYGLAIGRAIEQHDYPNVDFISKHKLDYWLDLWYKYQYDLTRPFEDSYYILRQLTIQNLPLAINTNRPQPRKDVEALLDHHKMLRYIQLTKTSREVGAKKPNPAGLIEICHEFDVNPEDVVCIGDSVADIKAAQNISMDVIAVATGIFNIKDLLKFHPNKVVLSLTDALNALQNI